jgi:hypothetical protein
MSFLSRKRPSPAMVVACVALSFALAGSAVAGTEAVTSAITKKKVKKIAKKQANKQLKANVSGSHVNLADKATNADNATNAANATNAVNAQNASAVNGNTIVRINSIRASGAAEAQVLNLNGLILEVTCLAGGQEDIEADTTVQNGEFASHGEDPQDGSVFDVINDDFDPGDDSQVSPIGVESTHDFVYNIRYTGGDGRNVVVELSSEDDIGTNDCVVTGYAIGQA